MSPTASTNSQTQFLAKDGLYYATYKEMREANVRANLQHLENLGLQEYKPLIVPKKRTLQRVAAPEQVRRSTRVRKEVTVLQMLHDDDRPLHKKSKIRRRNTTTTDTSQPTTTHSKSLSHEQRHSLPPLPAWLDTFHHYLHDVEHLSTANTQSVLRQVRRLASGEGIAYSRWPPHVKFQATISVHSDYDALYQRALEHESIHGRDLGNGWLLRHPIKKLQRFQEYWYQQQQQQQQQKSNVLVVEESEDSVS
jgi:hypothetical protein